MIPDPFSVPVELHPPFDALPEPVEKDQKVEQQDQKDADEFDRIQNITHDLEIAIREKQCT